MSGVWLFTAKLFMLEERRLSIVSYEDCPFLPSTVVVKHNLTVYATGRGETVLNGYINVSEDFVLDSTRLTVYNCYGEPKVTVLTENCEILIKTIRKNTCVLFEDKTQFWAPIISSITPSILCSDGKILKNSYKMTNGTFHVGEKIQMILLDGRWTVQMEHFNDKKEIKWCVVFQVEIFTQKRHQAA